MGRNKLPAQTTDDTLSSVVWMTTGTLVCSGGTWVTDTLLDHVLIIRTVINNTTDLYIHIKQNVLFKFVMVKMYSITGGCTWLQLGWLHRSWSQVSGGAVVWSGVCHGRESRPLALPRVCVCVCRCVCACVYITVRSVSIQSLTWWVCCWWHRQAYTHTHTLTEKGEWQVSLFGQPACLHFPS